MNQLQEGFVLGDRYRLESRIASGGMADVWRGTDDVLQRHVAVKVMRPDTDHERLFALRFRDEAVHSAALLHTNIATVFDYGEDQGLAFLVMELVEGQPLSAILNERGNLPPHEVRSIMGQAALALGVAHEARVVHRDVKPANIMVREDGLVKLTDFGIARALDASGHTQHGEMLGTPNYISPEQALGHAATGASDLYALGVVAHEMLVGRRPFDRGTPIATALSHVNEEPPPLPDTVPADLRELITECLEKDPEKRPANAAAVAVRLGLGDQELRGLALGLATAINGSPADLMENVEELAGEVGHPTGTATAAEGPIDSDAGAAGATGADDASGADDDGLEPTRAMPTPAPSPVPSAHSAASTAAPLPLPSEHEDSARGA